MARLDLVSSPGVPRPGYAPATRTPEGYLLVDALIARDGLLEYSDGTDSWIEYRPRAELEKAAASWTTTPVTDDHPQSMVDAETWATVARGVHMRAPSIEVHDGVTYLRAPLLITDAGLLKKITDGRRELSIGFTSEVLPQEGTTTTGEKFDAVQTQLLGNHTAVVDQGRAGPACRLLMDAAVHLAAKDHAMSIKNQRPAAAGARADNLGQAVEQAPYKMPDGSEVMLPTAIVAMLERLAMLEAGQTQGLTEGVRAPAPQPPADPTQGAPAAAPAITTPAPMAAAPSIPVAPVAPVAPAVKPDAPPPAAAASAPAPAPEEEKEKEKEMDKIDSLEKRFDRRRKLERHAITCGLPVDKLDGATSDERNDEIAREIVKARMPWMEEESKTLKGDALDILVATAVKMPRQSPRTDVNPFAQPAPIARRTDASDAVQLKFLKSQGCA